MSSTKSEQTEPTYLSNNYSYNANAISFDLHLPSPVGYNYEFGAAFNISKDIAGATGEVNAICLFMKKNSNNNIALASTADTRETFNLNISTLIQFYDSKAIPFDDKKDTVCVIIIHNDVFSLDLVDICFHDLESHIHDLTPETSPRTIQAVKKSIDKIFIPRKLGVSIIKR